MAENESLDLRSPQAQRWNAVRDAAFKGASRQKVGSVARTKLYEAIRKVLKQFKDYGVSTADFLIARGQPRAIRELMRKTEGHEFAELLAATLGSHPEANDYQCLKEWLSSVVDKMFDQISHDVVGSDCSPTIFDTQLFFEGVWEELEGDLDLIANKLAEDPNCRLRRPAKKGEPKVEATADMLTMSLIGGSKQ